MSLAAAFFAGLSDIFAKKALQTSRYQTIAFVRPAWGVLFLLPFLPWATLPPVWKNYLLPISLAGPLEVVAVLMFQRALQISPISLSIPFLAFTPVFLLLEGWLFLGEVIPPQGIAGILCVAVGAFILQEPLTHPRDWDWKKLIPRDKGPLMMLLVAFIFSLTSVLAKQALLASSPIFFGLSYYSLIALGLLFFQGGSKTWAKELVAQPGLFSLIGIVEAAGVILIFTAFQSGPVAFIIAIKRLSLLFSVFLGWLVFKETDIVSRATGAALMSLGAVLIGLI